jgi:hypothetical protein
VVGNLLPDEAAEAGEVAGHRGDAHDRKMWIF